MDELTKELTKLLNKWMIYKEQYNEQKALIERTEAEIVRVTKLIMCDDIELTYSSNPDN